MKQSKMALSSLATTLLMIAVFGSLSALAADEAMDATHPCAEYVKQCKAENLTPGHGLWKCVAKEAKKAKNEACIAKLKEGAKKMREHKKEKEAAEKAAE